MKKVKLLSIDRIINTNSISNIDDFKTYANNYKSSRTFITLNEERLHRLENEESRRAISQLLTIKMDDDYNLVIESAKKASLLIKYLCYKIFLDKETDDLLEASTIIKIQMQENA